MSHHPAKRQEDHDPLAPYEALYAPRRRPSCLWGLVGAGGCLATVLIVVALLVGSGVTALGEVLGSLNLTSPQAGPPTAQTTAPPTTATAGQTPSPLPTLDRALTVLTSIRPLGQLVSYGFQLARADIGVNIRQGVLDSCSFSTHYVAEGVIEAGIDLTGVGPGDVRYDAAGDVYTLTLPAPQLTGCHVAYIDQYNQSLTLCPVDWDAARQLGQHIALTTFRDEALESGILERARQQATLIVGNFVQSLTGSRVEIVYRAEPPTLPPSCRPEPPEGWTYDAATGVWARP